MRVPVILAGLLTAAPACALDIADMPTWSAEAHVVRAGTSYDTVLVFRRTGPGAWSVRVECQVMDVRTRAWRAHKAAGTATAQNGILVGKAGGLGQFVVAGHQMMFDDPRCATGDVTYGSGD
ncbi:hypothetical protein AAII07_55285 [Microvirga sp. 0TCS3.31]